MLTCRIRNAALLPYLSKAALQFEHYRLLARGAAASEEAGTLTPATYKYLRESSVGIGQQKGKGTDRQMVFLFWWRRRAPDPSGTLCFFKKIMLTCAIKDAVI